MNHLKTFTLLAAMAALFVGAGYMVGGVSGMAIALVLAGAMNIFSYWNSDKLVLRMYGAQPVDESHPNSLVRTYVADVHELADRAGLSSGIVSQLWMQPLMGVTYALLAEKLAAIGVVENERNLNNKISRGGFTGAFLIQCLTAMGVSALRLED